MIVSLRILIIHLDIGPDVMTKNLTKNLLR